MRKARYLFLGFGAAMLFAISSVSAGQLQGQQQKQGQVQLQGQAQGQIGIVKNSGSAVDVSNNTDVDAEPAYAPDVATFRPTVPCEVPIGGSFGALGLVSLGAQTSLSNQHCKDMETAVKCLEFKKAVPNLDCSAHISIALATSEEEREAHRSIKRESALAKLQRDKSPKVASLNPVGWVPEFKLPIDETVVDNSPVE